MYNPGFGYIFIFRYDIEVSFTVIYPGIFLFVNLGLRTIISLMIFITFHPKNLTVDFVRTLNFIRVKHHMN